ncbi:MAG: galactokinase [Acidobacteriota bacterium]|nr:galactokinase [Acidobacteriota bacterium]
MTIFRAPGRVNLIGEHTDYNLGFVLPIALDLETQVDLQPPLNPGELRVNSAEYHETAVWLPEHLASEKPKHAWTDYVVGVAQQLIKLGFDIRPRQLSISSTVPEGAGLSSSAAIEVSTALALLNGRPIEPLELAKLCQRAEREFVGVPSGIMDQYISVFGRPGQAVLIDCRSLEHEYVELPPRGMLEIWAVNSMVKHTLGSSAYRERVEQCAMAVDAIARRYPEVKSLRDATLPQLESTPLPNVILRRARHVITENARVQLFVSAARKQNLPRMGELFYESHLSMQHDYEISCEEIDFLVQAAKSIEGVYGARMTGGGFGGCTVNLVRPEAVSHFQSTVTQVYKERFDIVPDFIPCIPSAGAMQ